MVTKTAASSLVSMVVVMAWTGVYLSRENGVVRDTRHLALNDNDTDVDDYYFEYSYVEGNHVVMQEKIKEVPLFIVY